jgi:hypothetical protein
MCNNIYVELFNNRIGDIKMRRQNWLKYIIFLLLIFILAFIYYKLFKKIGYSNHLPDINDWISIAVGIIGLIETLVLGIVVFRQTNYFSKFNSAQHNIFMGVHRLEKNVPLKDNLISLSPEDSRIPIMVSFLDEGYSILTRIKTSDSSDESKTCKVTFSLMAKTQLMIKSLKILHIGYELKLNSLGDIKGESVITSEPVFCLLENNNNIFVNIDFIGCDKKEVKLILLKIKYRIVDQYDLEHTIVNDMEISCIYSQYILVSNQSCNIKPY